MDNDVDDSEEEEEGSNSTEMKSKIRSYQKMLQRRDELEIVDELTA